MSFCPNPECRHRQRTGKPAEFREGITTCPDCASALVEENPVKPAERPPCPPPLRRRILFSLAVAAVLWLAMLIPPPFVFLGALQDAFDWTLIETALNTGPLSRGPNPFLIGFVLVEIVALLVPRLRRRRHGDAPVRGKLNIASLALGVVVSMLGAYSIALYIESVGWYGLGPAAVENPGWAFRLGFMLVSAAGTCLYVVAAQLINRFGVGSGFAVVILTFMLSEVPPLLFLIWHYLADGALSPLAVLVLCAAAAGAFAGVWWFLHLPDKHPGKLPLRLPTCGLFPLELAFLIMIAPVTLNQYFEFEWFERLAGLFTPGNKAYLLLEVGLMVVFVPLVSSMFYWRRRKAFAAGENRAEWRRARIHSAVFLACVIGAWYLLYHPIRVAVVVFPSSLALVGSCAIISDLAAEIRARWHAAGGGDLVVLETHQDVADAIEARVEKGVVIQGLYYRSLTYFFGPFVPLKILGPETERELAAANDPSTLEK